MRGKEGAGHTLGTSFPTSSPPFPSPCGVRRVRDVKAKAPRLSSIGTVSVPLRGKEGAGHMNYTLSAGSRLTVSVPLRGKEGAGPRPRLLTSQAATIAFPSPCGVRRVRDSREGVLLRPWRRKFPSPCGVRRVRDDRISHNTIRQFWNRFPSPCGVRRVRDTRTITSTKTSLGNRSGFPSPCGVRRVRDLHNGPLRPFFRGVRFRPLAG